MENSIKKIYELLHSPILTPYNLLENVKIDNYKYVKYYKGDQGVICEMLCTFIDGADVKYFYQFDKNDYLFEVFQEKDNGIREKIFTRQEELQNQIKKYKNKDVKLSAI